MNHAHQARQAPSDYIQNRIRICGYRSVANSFRRQGVPFELAYRLIFGRALRH